MSETEIIKKKAQVEILEFLLNHLCNSELPEIGRTAVKRLIRNINEDVTRNTEK